MKKTQKAKSKLLSFSVKGTPKKDLPSYVTVNGVVYEKTTTQTVSVSFDLDPEVNEAVQRAMKKGGYVSEQELIREVVRNAVWRK